MAGPVNAGQAPATSRPGAPRRRPGGADAARGRAAAPLRDAAAPFPEGAKIAYVNVQRIASESVEGQAATKRASLREEKEKDLAARNAKFEGRPQAARDERLGAERVGAGHPAEGSRAAAETDLQRATQEPQKALQPSSRKNCRSIPGKLLPG